MSIDIELAKSYKEYSGLQEKLPSLRSEYSFLYEDIKKREVIKDSLDKQIISARTLIENETQEREKRKAKVIADINTEKSAWDSKKSEESDILIVSNRELGAENKILLESIAISESTLGETKKDISEGEKKLVVLKDNIKEYEQAIKDIREQDIKKSKDIADRMTLCIEAEKKNKIDSKIAEDGISKYEEIKRVAEEKIALLESMYADYAAKEISLQKKITEDEELLSGIGEKEAKIIVEQKKATEIFNEMQAKEIIVVKKMIEFQEERQSFYLLMKQKGISKSDIDKLEKNFNI